MNGSSVSYDTKVVWFKSNFSTCFVISQAWPKKGLKTLVSHLSQWWWLQLVPSSLSFLPWAVQVWTLPWNLICWKNSLDIKRRALNPVLIDPCTQSFKQMLPQVPLLAACSSQSTLSDSSLKERGEFGKKKKKKEVHVSPPDCRQCAVWETLWREKALLMFPHPTALRWHLDHVFSAPWEPCCREPCSLLFDFSPLKWPARQRAPSGDWLLAQHRLGVQTRKGSLPADLFLWVRPSERTVHAVIGRCHSRHIQDIPTCSHDSSAKVTAQSVSEKQRLLSK